MFIAIFLYLSYRKICQRMLTLSGHILYANPFANNTGLLFNPHERVKGLNKS